MKRRHKQHHEEHADETWLIPYSDLLTLLLALFIVLFASSTLDAKKFDKLKQSFSSAFEGGIHFFQLSPTLPLETNEFAVDPAGTQMKRLDKEEEQRLEQIRQETEDLKNLQEKLNDYIAMNNLSSQLETQLTEDMLKITIRDQTLFDSGSATVKPESRKLAVAIADMLAQYPKYKVEIAGHTDNVPIRTAEFDSNWELSFQRAYNFMKLLAQNPGIDPARFMPVPHGEYSPIESNDTAEGRAKNRRVEVSILKSAVTERKTDLEGVPQAIPAANP
ncbi:flagellar motor protein MotB [Paenibacillus thermoaerophilus]|uniref:Flagellar motor protein MotB n=1 Tax=Paenibacillus thermoaerophilus TaxID=1215385 RepID=A0ABW2V259_9BACL|nr:flagellar motor protein MotB [Paenibacillus thermoaerophilus]